MTEPIEEVSQPKIIQQPGKCRHQYELETKGQMDSYVCKKCGHGLLLTKDDDIINYQK